MKFQPLAHYQANSIGTPRVEIRGRFKKKSLLIIPMTKEEIIEFNLEFEVLSGDPNTVAAQLVAFKQTSRKSIQKIDIKKPDLAILGRFGDAQIKLQEKQVVHL